MVRPINPLERTAVEKPRLIGVANGRRIVASGDAIPAARPAIVFAPGIEAKGNGGKTMLKRCALIAVALSGLSSFSGCIISDAVMDTHNRWLTCYQRTHWMEGQCGEFYWSEWFNDPPACCDPCNKCGNFVGERCCKRSIPLKERGCFNKIKNNCCHSCGHKACSCDTVADADGDGPIHHHEMPDQGGYQPGSATYGPDEVFEGQAPSPRMSKARLFSR